MRELAEGELKLRFNDKTQILHGHTYRLRAKLYNKTVFVRSAENESEEEVTI